ncbi:family 43 glycosylhydrolase [Massilia sp. TS11]|nr:family 43 glycosylhydrolase [Massilia sp. TS11]
MPVFGEPVADRGQIAAKPLFRDPIFDGAADPVVVHAGPDRWVMFYTNRRANAYAPDGVSWVHGTQIGMAESRDGGAHWTHLGVADIEIPPELGGDQATLWAPDVVRDEQGNWHMFLTVVPGIFSDWKHPRHMVHLRSRNLQRWEDAQAIPLPTQRAIDASLVRLPEGGWRMFYNNEEDKKSIWYADSPDLVHWNDRGRAVGDQGGEGPKVFRWKQAWWMITDVWAGLAVYRSDDGLHWQRQPGNLLAEPGKSADDQVKGGHADVVVVGERAWLFYFTHPEHKDKSPMLSYAQRRSSIQVVELQERDGQLSAERDAPTRIALRAD